MDSNSRGFWERVRRDWDTPGLTLAGLARQNGVPAAAVLAHAATNKWPVRPHEQDRLILIQRLLGVVELQITHLEEMVMTGSGEKEAAVLSKLTEQVGRLISLHKAECGGGSDSETAEMRDIRERLAARINALTKK